MVNIRLTFDMVRAELRSDAEREAFNEALVEFEREAWRRGFELGAQVVQRNAEDVIAQAALAVLGKDRADGEIDLGALGKRFAQ
jgi:hypothetical protein